MIDCCRTYGVCARLTMVALAAALVIAPDAQGVQDRASPPALSKDWKRLRSEHFAVVGNASQGDLRHGVRALEGFRLAMATVFPSLRLTSPVPTTILVVKEETFARLRPLDERGRRRQNVGGYFEALPHVNYIVLPTMWGSDMTLQVAFHEYTHYVINRNLHHLPLWLSEGLAEFYSTVDVDAKSGQIVIGKPPGLRITILRSGHLLRLKELLGESGDKLFKDDERAAMFYAESWAFVDFLSLGRKRIERGQIDRYLAALKERRSIDEAVHDGFGVTTDDLENEFRVYLNRVPIPTLIFRPREGASIEPRGALEPMVDADVQAVLGDLFVSLGAHEDAERTLTKILETDPSNVGAQVSLGRLRLDQIRPDDALAVLDSAVRTDPSSFAAHYYRANALESAERFEDALTAYDRAVKLNPESAAAWLGLSLATLALGRDTQSSAAMAQVVRLDSSPSWYRGHAYGAFDIGKDEAVLSDVEAYAREAGWTDEGTLYTAILGVLANLRLGRPDDAAALSARALRAIAPESWHAALFDFLGGTLTADALLRRAKDNGDRTEAHTYIGIRAAIAGRKDEAVAHLTWVRDRGSRTYVEYPLALGVLRKQARGNQGGS
ncbi:MAG: hypothetical protein DMF86_14900 [Acidobacteria bacterium]|nr:MAG: hypothetical protein DMF86_14900 [Acidobacteriota bacterium]